MATRLTGVVGDARKRIEALAQDQEHDLDMQLAAEDRAMRRWENRASVVDANEASLLRMAQRGEISVYDLRLSHQERVILGTAIHAKCGRASLGLRGCTAGC